MFDQGACMLDAQGTLNLQTYAMPKGWFNSRNTFDLTKTEVRVSETLSATSCVQGAGEVAFTSKAFGSFKQGPNFSPLYPTSKEIGYYWSGVGDLSAQQNDWWYYTGCDGKPVRSAASSPWRMAVKTAVA